jgi:hypothetical protein
VNKPYVAKVGTPDTLKQIDSEGDHEHLVSASNVYEAHKQAMFKCKGVEEVLTITLNNKRVYDIVTGFAEEF